MTLPSEIHEVLQKEVGTILIGNEDVLESITISLLTSGHILLEGVPGVAKTTIATLFSRATGLDYNRIQMTPDMLPADITGTHVYRKDSGEFELSRGPIFANVVVVDEINRATPKTQSALLEAMQEGAVTIEGETLPLPEPFIVIATQNPVEIEGVYELPKAQRDRFQFKLTVDLPNEDRELSLIDRFDEDPELGPEQITQVLTVDEILRARQIVADVHVDDRVKKYIRDVVSATRDHPELDYGASPRATLALLDGAKARASIHGREYTIYDDVKALGEQTLGHRVVLNTDAELSDRDPTTIIKNVVESVTLPEDDFASDHDEQQILSDGNGSADDSR